MAKDRETGKWASEAFEFMRLFQRTKASPIGLLLLIIGWALLLLLIAGLAAEGEGPKIVLPTISDPVEVGLQPAFSVGALAITLVWLLTSRLYLYVWLPLRHLLRDVAALAMYPILALYLVLYVITLPLAIVFYPWRQARARKWKEANPQQVEELRKRADDVTIDRMVRKKINLPPEQWRDKIGLQLGEQLSALASVSYVGLSPLFSYSLEEDQHAAKAPLQVFASAIARLRYRFPRMHVARYIRFVVLPSMPGIESDDTARTVRRWLRLDALLWGSYISVTPPYVWLNIQQRMVEPSDAATSPEDLSWDAEDWRLMYPLKADPVDTSTLVLDQSDPLDAYIAIIFTVLSAAKAREQHRSPLRNRYFDKIVADMRGQAKLQAELLSDALFEIRELPQPVGRHRTVKQALVRWASAWVGKEIDGWWMPNILDTKPSTSLLFRVASHCVLLEPYRAEHHYRLAAVLVALEQAEAAIESLAKGLEIERSTARFLDPIKLYVSAASKFPELHESGNTGQHGRMFSIVGIARARTFGNDWVRKKLVEDFLKSKFHEMNELLPAGIRSDVGARLIYRLLDVRMPGVESDATSVTESQHLAAPHRPQPGNRESLADGELHC